MLVWLAHVCWVPHQHGSSSCSHAVCLQAHKAVSAEQVLRVQLLLHAAERCQVACASNLSLQAAVVDDSGQIDVRLRSEQAHVSQE